jgi:hypothetical protein
MKCLHLLLTMTLYFLDIESSLLKWNVCTCFWPCISLILSHLCWNEMLAQCCWLWLVFAWCYWIIFAEMKCLHKINDMLLTMYFLDNIIESSLLKQNACTCCWLYFLDIESYFAETKCFYMLLTMTLYLIIQLSQNSIKVEGQWWTILLHFILIVMLHFE